ncbi:MAG TPA: ABC transporter permease, partial [Thermoanaerobaculia bacterium]|nr:ABC transporter permease [Thermoanaerobaculia bacterium]
MTSLRLDLRFAARALARRPGFAVTVTLALALGVGANTALVSLADALLFRGLPYPQAERLVRLFPLDVKGKETNAVSYPEVVALARASRTLDRVVPFSSSSDVDLALSGHPPARAHAALVGGEYFPLLGVRAAHGRMLGGADDRAGAPAVAVLAEPFWRRTFGADPAVVGRIARVNRQAVEVIGVVPLGFLGVSLDDAPDLWLPMAQVSAVLPHFAAVRPLEATNFGWVDTLARLAPGATPAAARAEVELVRRELGRGWGKKLAPRMSVLPAREALIAASTRPLALRTAWLLFGAGALVLSLAGLVAGVLMLLRGELRHRELAVRRSIGASSSDLLRVVASEAFLLGLAGAAAGVLLARAWQQVLVALLPPDFPLLPAAVSDALGARLLAIASAAGLLVALVAGAIPLWRERRRDPVSSLEGERPMEVAGWRLPLRSALIVLQVGLSVVILSAAGLLLRTLWKASRVDAGISTQGVVLASINLSRQGYDKERGERFWQDLLADLAARPGVDAVALARHVPVDDSGMYTTMVPEGYRAAPDEMVGTTFNVVSPDYFRAL